MKLTPKQRDVLSNRAGLFRHFDVYGGFWYTIGRDGARVHNRTAESLLYLGAMEVGKSERVYSGRQIAECTVTDAGLAALRSPDNG